MVLSGVMCHETKHQVLPQGHGSKLQFQRMFDAHLKFHEMQQKMRFIQISNLILLFKDSVAMLGCPL